MCVAIKYHFAQKKFSCAIGHNANFVWKQDEVPQNSRYANKLYGSLYNEIAHLKN